jgi:signal transduction histidine kinase
MGRLLGVSPASLEERPIDELLEPGLSEPFSEISEFECSLTPDGAPPIPVSICTSLLRDKQGNPIGLVLVTRDLREVESLRSRLITSGRLASVGQLAAGIAHEINNPVAYVRANLGTLGSVIDGLESKLPHDDPATRAELSEARELIEESLEGVDRVASIVRDVKSFSHSGEGSHESVELRPLLESALRIAAPQLRHSSNIVRSYGEALSVRGAPQELKQVFMNLVINASQAVEAGQSIELATRGEGDRVIVEVRDEGCGIPPDQIERVFDPFFTTKRVGEGTGLGLSISYQIVQQHGGDLSVQCVPGQGTCFRVELPAAVTDGS